MKWSGHSSKSLFGQRPDKVADIYVYNEKILRFDK